MLYLVRYVLNRFSKIIINKERKLDGNIFLFCFIFGIIIVVMEVRKIKKKRQTPTLIEEETSYSLKSIIGIVVVIAIVFVGFYFLTTIVINNQSTNNTDTNITEDYQTEKILFGQLLTRKESEYYVYAYDETSKSHSLYSQYLTEYSKKDNALEVYRIDINDGMNKEYVSNKSNIGTDLTDLQVSGITLFKIKDGQIVESYTGVLVGNALKKLVSN